MRAAYRADYCDVDQIELRDLPLPEPGPLELRVRVAATTVNRTDCHNLTGKPWMMHLALGVGRPRLPTVGTDVVGVVDALGADVRGWQVGDALWGFKDMGLGSQAEFACVSVRDPVLPLPAGVDPLAAVASLEGPHYALNFLNKVSLQPGQRALVYGAMGAVGSAILQLARSKGVQVTGICGSADLASSAALGNPTLLNYETGELDAHRERYDYFFDAVGKRSYGFARRWLADDGIYISSELGAGWQNLWLTLAGRLTGRRRVRFPLPLRPRDSMRTMADQLVAGSYRPLIDRRFSLADIRDAYRYVDSGRKQGNVALIVDADLLERMSADTEPD
ncbi:MAG: NAD(P)-dependent alcohol dehydrogenase [Pseudomonadota bacterium]